MELTQSWLMTISRYSFTLYEQRILLAVIDECQDYFAKKYLRLLQGQRPDYPKSDRVVKIKMATVLGDNDTHYTRVKAAVKSLQSKQIESYNPETRVWECSPLIGTVRHVEHSGVMTVTVPSMFLKALYDLRMGYSQYDLNAALQLTSPYSMRMYAIVAHQAKPLTFNVVHLKQMFGVADKYSQTRDFLKRCIDPAQKELSASHLPSFKYERVFKGQAVVALKIERVMPERAVSSYSNPNAADLQQALGEEMWNLLTMHVGFTLRELKVHEALFKRFLKLPVAYDLLRDIVHRWYKGKKSKGYIINALKSESRAFKG